MANIIHPNLNQFTQPCEQRLWDQVDRAKEWSRPVPVVEHTVGPVPFVVGGVFAGLVVMFLTLSLGPDAALIDSPALCQLVAIFGLVGFTFIVAFATVACILRLISGRLTEVQAFAFSALGASFGLMAVRAIF